MSGYIKKLSEIKLRKSLAECLKNEFRNTLDENQYRFILHIVSCSKANKPIPIPFTVIESYLSKKFKSKQITALIDMGLISRDECDRSKNKCYYYCIGSNLKKLILENEVKDINSMIDDSIVNMSNFRKTQPLKSQFKCDDSEEVQESIKKIRFNKINIDRLDEIRHRDLQESISSQDSRVRLRFLSNNQCLDAVIRQGLTVENGIGTYIPAYKSSKTGRFFERGGGMQNISRPWKAAAYDLPNVHNYDLKSSQIMCILEIGSEKLSDNTLYTLREYVNSNKSDYATKAGVSVDTWKQCLLSLFFGAHIASNINSSVYRYIMKECNNNPGLAIEKYKLMKPVLNPFIAASKDWFKVIRRYCKSDRKRSNNKYWILNAMNKRMCISESKYGEISAFLLQGLESCFIYALISVSDKYRYNVLSLEHDGLVVEGTIPESAINYAKSVRNFLSATLIEKPID